MKIKLNSTIVRPALIFLLAIAGGCATLMRGGNQKIDVVTEPAGANLVVDGKSYTTPVTVSITRKKSYEVVVTKAGFQGVKFMLNPHWDAGGAGAVAMDAIIPGGSVLFIVDTIAGADRQFDKIATIKLPPATQPAPEIVTLYEHKGVLMSKTDYDEACAEDGLFGKKKNTTATPVPTAVAPTTPAAIPDVAVAAQGN